MDTATQIDQLLQFGLELKLTDAYVTTEWRPRALKALKLALGEVCAKGDWPWLHTNTLLTWDGNNADPESVEAPANFRRVGPTGGLFLVGSGKVDYVMPDIYLRKREGFGVSGVGTNPLIYTIPGTSANRRMLINILPFPAAGQTVTLKLYYEKLKPTLIDSSSAGANGLDELPEDLAQDAVYIGALDWLLFGQGDARTVGEVSPRFRKALDDFWTSSLPDLDGLLVLGDEGIALERMW